MPIHAIPPLPALEPGLLTDERLRDLLCSKVLSLDSSDDPSCDGGYRLRLQQQADDGASINDFDCYGRVEWTHRRRSRPDSFDGSAEIIARDSRGSLLWWLPYRDGRRVHNDQQDRLLVLDLISHGFQSIGLVLEGPALDASGRAHLVTLAEAWIGGVEPFPSQAGLTLLIRDLLYDVIEQLRQLQEDDSQG